jgi:hypothetical protein
LKTVDDDRHEISALNSSFACSHLRQLTCCVNRNDQRFGIRITNLPKHLLSRRVLGPLASLTRIIFDQFSIAK